MNKNIAIDGPAGAGKSTIAKRVAEKLHLVYVDTGAMYRAIGYCMKKRDIECGDLEKIRAALSEIRLDLSYENGEQQIFLNGENVSGWIRTPEISEAASDFAAIPEVREKLLELQRELAERRAVVMDGRDIGTKVLPDASVKIFLTADTEVRALRRYKELQEKGISVVLSELEEEIRRRDENDMKREASPLRQAEDAALLDTSAMGIEEVVTAIIEIAKKRNPDFFGKDR